MAEEEETMLTASGIGVDEDMEAVDHTQKTSEAT